MIEDALISALSLKNRGRYLKTLPPLQPIRKCIIYALVKEVKTFPHKATDILNNVEGRKLTHLNV
jgi:hypothetical protein